jgi:hypothetical protein
MGVFSRRFEKEKRRTSRPLPLFALVVTGLAAPSTKEIVESAHGYSQRSGSPKIRQAYEFIELCAV